jgi:hypothetical protein
LEPVAAVGFVFAGWDREVVAAAGTDLEVLRVPCFANYRSVALAEEEGIGRAVLPAQIHKRDIGAEVLHVMVVVGSAGVEEAPGSWLVVDLYKSSLHQQGCWASGKGLKDKVQQPGEGAASYTPQGSVGYRPWKVDPLAYDHNIEQL